MNIFEIIGPVMVGPSSSHTAGAVRIGRVAGQLLGEKLCKAEILLYGSFLTTGKGHGTDCALIAGLLGMREDNPEIGSSFEIADKAGIDFCFGEAQLVNAHPNTAVLKLTGIHGKKLEIEASSTGGGCILIKRMNDIEVNFDAEFPTLIIRNKDIPGLVAAVSYIIEKNGINIAEMQVYRNIRGGEAVMTVECDESISRDLLSEIQGLDGVIEAVCYNGNEMKRETGDLM